MTRPHQPSEQGLRFLLRLAQMARPVVSAGILKEEIGRNAGYLIKQQYLLPNSNRQSMLLPVGETETDIPVDFNPDDGKLRCFHPESGFIDIDPEKLTSYQLNTGQLTFLVQAMLDMPASMKPQPLVPDLLWDLGEDYLTQRKFPIYFARNLDRSSACSNIINALSLKRARGPSLLISTGPIPSHVSLPPEVRAVNFADCLVPDESGVRLDKAILRGALLGVASPGHEKPISHTSNYSVVTVHGKEYPFKGTRQRMIVGQLVRAFVAGTPSCLTAKVLEEAECGNTVNTLAKAFSKRTDWKDFITEEGGSCWIFL